MWEFMVILLIFILGALFLLLKVVFEKISEQPCCDKSIKNVEVEIVPEKEETLLVPANILVPEVIEAKPEVKSEPQPAEIKPEEVIEVKPAEIKPEVVLVKPKTRKTTPTPKTKTSKTKTPKLTLNKATPTSRRKTSK